LGFPATREPLVIRLGSLAGYSFEGPSLLGGWTPPDQPGLYVLMYKPDPEGKPDTYAVIYVGHSDNLADEGFPWKHPAAHCWAERAGSKWQVYVSFFHPPGGTRTHREAIARELIAVYDPACNPERYDRAWRAEWIGEYDTDGTGPLAPRGADHES
jgi:hypothetical protein